MPDDQKGKEPSGHCDDCVRADFGTVKKLVFAILAATVLSGSVSMGLGGFLVYAGNDKNSEQDSRITAVETNQVTVLKQLDEQNQKLDTLIHLNTSTVIKLNALEIKIEGE